MRLRKRHAWGAVLIALFALPVWRPEGFPSVERVPASFFGWAAKSPVLNPRLWRSPTSDDDAEDSPRVAAMEREIGLLHERLAEAVEQLRSLQDLKGGLSQPELDKLPVAQAATVIRGTDPSDVRQSVRIDRGTDEGLREGLAVVEGAVLIGRVHAVQGSTSLVQLVTDSHSRLEVMLRTEKGVRVKGYLFGSARARSGQTLEVRFTRIPQHDDRILPGTPVFTSNADERVPVGLLVGTVTRVEDPDADGMPVLQVKPAVDPTDLLEVWVLEPR